MENSLQTESPALPRSRQTALELLLLGSLCLALLCPFLNRPLHIDDPVYVWTAQHIVKNPVDFYGFRMNWQGTEENVSDFLESPPLVSFFLAAASRVVGWSEMGLHASFLPIHVLTVLGMYGLAGRFCRRPWLATMLLLLCPGFLISATTLMCEPLLICLWIWSVLLWIRGSDRMPMLLPIAGLLVAAAVLCKFIAISLVPLLLLYSLIHPREWSARIVQFTCLLIPVAALVAYETFTAHRYGSGGVWQAANYVHASQSAVSVSFVMKTLNALAFVGGGGAAAMFLLLPTLRRNAILFAALSVGLLTFFFILFLPVPPGWGTHAVIPGFPSGLLFYGQYAMLSVAGLVLLLTGYRQSRAAFRRRSAGDELFLLSWIAGIFVFAAFVNWVINARAMLPLLPPVCIFVVRRFDSHAVLPAHRIKIAVVLSGIFALITTIADYRLAVITKQAAEILTAQQSSTPVWFDGHWGFQYYMQMHGAREINEMAPQYHVGDRFIFPASRYGGTAAPSGFRPLQSIDVGQAAWCSCCSTRMGVNFYSSYGFSLPFLFGPFAPERFLTVEVTQQSRIQ